MQNNAQINIEKISRGCLKVLAVVNTMEFQFIVVIQTQNKNFDMANSVQRKLEKSLESFDCSIYTRFSCIQCKSLLTSLTIQYKWRYTISCVAIYCNILRDDFGGGDTHTSVCVCVCVCVCVYVYVCVCVCVCVD